MANINPYQAPQATVDDAPPAPSALASGPNSVAVGNGATWISDGWNMFRQAKGTWIAIAVIELIIFIVLSAIPVVGQLVSFFIPFLLAGGLMIGCQAMHRNEQFSIGHLFAGFQSHLQPLVVVGAIYLAAFVAILAIAAFFTGGGVFAAFLGMGSVGSALSTLMISVLMVLGASIPLAMAVWFAPALVTLHDMPPLEAMKLSFTGCLKNILPFLVYGVIGLVLAVVASIPFFLGWLILLPILTASVYAAYRDIFLQH
jgi:uncharacterized membrane protein